MVKLCGIEEEIRQTLGKTKRGEGVEVPSERGMVTGAVNWYVQLEVNPTTCANVGASRAMTKASVANANAGQGATDQR